ncbi:MBL fold metallo-hydrolase [Oerskovia flava]|uniref:MBL fold metallo-hydrolase n=1 Tax=Oerskovia flava TaxID=2986422 RepID=UPI00223FC1E7|nr:MBL fold metallo-hydrolase [Oerskovia sp. JB1-3-2]
MTRDDAYTGDVQVGGPAAHRVLDEIEIRKLAVGPMANNAYLLTCRRDGAQVLVDAAADDDRLLDLVREGSGGARLDLVVTTHSHHDHLGALASIVSVTGAATVAGAADAEAIRAGSGVDPSQRVQHGDLLCAGHLTLEVIALRGHTPGSIALAYREPAHVHALGAVPGRVHLFTGDSLFPGGPGKTAGPADFARLMDNLADRVFDRFDDGTWVYPGHGADTTLGAERDQLPVWRARGW